MAGITADANILIDKARLDAQRYELKYHISSYRSTARAADSESDTTSLPLLSALFAPFATRSSNTPSAPPPPLPACTRRSLCYHQ
jgi:hypothetical protein